MTEGLLTQRDHRPFTEWRSLSERYDELQRNPSKALAKALADDCREAINALQPGELRWLDLLVELSGKVEATLARLTDPVHFEQSFFDAIAARMQTGSTEDNRSPGDWRDNPSKELVNHHLDKAANHTLTARSFPRSLMSSTYSITSAQDHILGAASRLMIAWTQLEQLKKESR